MSCPSLNRSYEQARTTPEHGTISPHHAAYVPAFEHGMPVGMTRVLELTAGIRRGEPQPEITLAPNSVAGRQLARLIGVDVARSVPQQHFGARFTFFNRCGVVAGGPKTREASEELLIKQVRLQQEEFVDC